MSPSPTTRAQSELIIVNSVNVSEGFDVEVPLAEMGSSVLVQAALPRVAGGC